MTSATAAARVFAIRARDGKTAAVFRRGPSKMTQLLLWDLRSDHIQPGQWLKAAVYPRRSDLTPDGTHLIFFAATHKGGPSANWTAISRPPYWTALHFYGQNHAWNGGGVFLDDRHYYPDLGFGSSTKARMASRLVRSQNAPSWLQPGMGEDMRLYLPRLERDGWEFEGHERSGTTEFKKTDVWTFTKPIREKWSLRKSVTASIVKKGPYGEVYWETHQLLGAQEETDLNDEWAEVDRRSVIYTVKGALYRMRVHRKGPDEPVRIADLSPNRFSNVTAPYEGVARKRA